MKVENAVRPNKEQIEGSTQPGAEGPIFMVNLLRFKDNAEYEDGRETELTGREAYTLYLEAVSELLQEFGGGAMFVADVERRKDSSWPLETAVHDMLEGPYGGDFDAAYSLDVLEHIERSREAKFLGNVARSLRPQGVLVIGTPSLTSQAHASPASKEGHINCKTAETLKALLQGFFHNVFIFSMNDEVVHTGFYAMAHYYFALCCAPMER